MKRIVGSFVLALIGTDWALAQESVQQKEERTRRLPEAALRLEAELRERLGTGMETIDLDLVMMGEDFFGAAPESPRFSWDGKRIEFSWKTWRERERGTHSYDIAGGRLERLPDEAPRSASWMTTLDRQWTVIREGPRIKIARTGEEPREVLTWDAPIEDLTLKPDGSALLFRSRSSLFELFLLSPGMRERLVLKDGPEPKEDDSKEPAKLLEESKKDLGAWHRLREEELFRTIHERLERARAAQRNEKARKLASPRVPVFHPPEGFKIRDVAIAPSGRHAAIILGKEGKDARVAEMPEYVSEDGYVGSRKTRPKVGVQPREQRLELVLLETGKRIEVQPPTKEDIWSWLNASWSPDGSVFLVSACTANDERAVLADVDLQSGEVRLRHEVTDPAWVRIRGFDPKWLDASGTCVFVSEASGYAQLWRFEPGMEKARALTTGRFEIHSPTPLPGGASLLAIATPTSPFVRDLVQIDAQSGEMSIHSAEGGGRSFVLSPDGVTVAEVASFANRPHELFLRRLDLPDPPRRITESPSPAFQAFPFQAPEILTIPASDGVAVPARIYRPKEGTSCGAAVLFVHGAGYLQNVHHWWSRYEREYAFHHLLTERGVTVLDLDYRGSSGYGASWRTAIRGHMGHRDLQDYVDAARWLVETTDVQPDRIGIYGGSYGGFLTLMALFRHPGVFRAGAALRPVTDWAHYNEGYTSDILDTPLENPRAYEISSPIDFAAGLKDALLICHGLLDDNVHAQDTVRLTQRLIELRKTTFEVAYYPMEAHGFVDAASWSDEYRRILGLFERTILR